MAVIGTVRVSNLAPYRRAHVVSTNIPLDPGQVSGTAEPQWVARSAYPTGTDVAVQVVQQGPSYADGSWRMARVTFPVELPAATTSGYGYPQYAERDIVVETGAAPPIPEFAEHEALDLADVRIRFAAHVTDGEYTGTTSERSAIFTPLAGFIPDYHAPYAATTPGRVEEPDTAAWSGGAWMRAYSVAGRIMPEASGGSEEEPSTYARLVYEVYNANVDGCRRLVRWWLEIGSSLVTEDDDARGFYSVDGRFVSPPYVELSRAAGSKPIRCWVDQQGCLTARASNDWSGVGSTIYPIDISADQNGGYLPRDSAIVRCGFFWFPDGTLSTLDNETRQATQWQAGENAIPDAVSTSWMTRHEPYGAFGVGYTPEEMGFDDVEQLRTALAAWSRTLVEYYRGTAWPPFPRHGNNVRCGDGGGQNGFGAFALFPWQASGHCDLRGVRWCVYLAPIRRRTWRDVNCDPVNFASFFRDPATPSSFRSSRILYNGIPWTAAGYASWRFAGGKAGFEGGSNYFGDGPGPGAGYSSCANSHYEAHNEIAYAMLTGDRWVTFHGSRDIREFALDSQQTTSGWNSLDDTVDSATGMEQARSAGRILKNKAHIYALTGESEILAEIAKRVHRHKEWADNGRGVFNPAVTAAWYSADVVCLEGETGYLDPSHQSHYSCSNVGSFAWETTGRGVAEAYTPFQLSLLTQGLWACTRMLELDATYATEAAEGRELAAAQGRSLLLHGYWQTPSDTREAFWYRDFKWDGNEGTAFSASEHGNYVRFCDVNGNPRTGKTRCGPQNLSRFGGQPAWAESSGVSWSTNPGALIGAYLTSTDPDTSAAIQDTLVERAPWPDAYNRRIGLTDQSENYVNENGVVPNPFTRWDSQTSGRTYEAVAAASLAVLTTKVDVEQVHTSSAHGEVEILGPDSFVYVHIPATASGAKFEVDSISASVDIATTDIGAELIQPPNETDPNDITFDRTASGSVTFSVTQPLAEHVEVHPVTADGEIAFSLALQHEIIRAPNVTVTVQVVVNDRETIDEAIGRDRRRARSAKVIRLPDGTLRRITWRGPWRGPEPYRRWWEEGRWRR